MPFRFWLNDGDDTSAGGTIGVPTVPAATPDYLKHQIVTEYNLERPLNSNQPFDWRCEISVPSSGLVRRSGEFNFEAPTDGYQSEEAIDMPASAPNWSDSFSQECFVQLSSGQHARIEFRLAAGGYNFFNITSYLNPTPGDRNLEYDPAKAIRPGH
jgi:hypothetical protein